VPLTVPMIRNSQPSREEHRQKALDLNIPDAEDAKVWRRTGHWASGRSSFHRVSPVWAGVRSSDKLPICRVSGLPAPSRLAAEPGHPVNGKGTRKGSQRQSGRGNTMVAKPGCWLVTKDDGRALRAWSVFLRPRRVVRQKTFTCGHVHEVESEVAGAGWKNAVLRRMGGVGPGGYLLILAG